MILTELDYQSTIEAPVPNCPQKLQEKKALMLDDDVQITRRTWGAALKR